MGVYLNPKNKGFQDAIHSEIYVDKTGLIACTSNAVSGAGCHGRAQGVVWRILFGTANNPFCRQIKEKRYTQALEGYSGEIVLVGINYEKDKENKRHSCVIERVER